MAKRIVLEAKDPAMPTKPALNPDDREQQIANAAYNLAEQQILNGTASSQVITHFLKVGSARERYERERLIEENKKLRAQTEALQSAKHIEELYSAAMQVFKGYQGIEEEQEEY